MQAWVLRSNTFFLTVLRVFLPELLKDFLTDKKEYIMKNDVIPSIVKMEKELLKRLVTEVKETVATDVHVPKAKKNAFSVVDLWNIQRNMKSASRLRR